MKPLLIGLSGKAGSGKSTVGDYLTGAHGYEQFAFAEALKEVVGLAFGFEEEQLYGRRKEAVDPRWGVSPRWCMQWLGTEVLRARWPQIWIYHLRREILDFLSVNGQHPVVVTDVRFQDEAEALKRIGGVLVRLRRDQEQRIEACATGFPEHISETDLDGWKGWDYVIQNNGSLQDLADWVEVMLGEAVEKAESDVSALPSGTYAGKFVTR
jgi:hypothetical protein